MTASGDRPTILSVSNFYDTHGGGLERVASHLNRQFSAAGYLAEWAACDADDTPDTPANLVPLRCANPIEKLTGLPMPIPGPRSIGRLNSAVARADLVVIHDALYFTSLAAMVLAKLHRRPVALVQHIGFIAFASPLLRLLMGVANFLVTRPMLAAADRLVFISETVRRDLLGSPPRRTSVLAFNGVDLAVFSNSFQSADPAPRARWGLPTDKRVAIFVGRFVEKKGLPVLRHLAETRPDLHFALAGKGPIDPASWGLPNVQLLGQQPQVALAELYRVSDFLILPSVGEGYPLVVQEAMASGLPVVCGRASAEADPQAAQWLQGVDIDLAQPELSAAACALAIDKLAAKGVDRDAMAEYCAEAYSWKKLAETVVGSAERRRLGVRPSKVELAA